MADEKRYGMGEIEFWAEAEKEWSHYCNSLLERITAMAEEEKPEKRPACDYKISDPSGRKPCGSEENIHIVKGTTPYGRKAETPICGPHRIDVVKKYNWDTIEPWRPK